MPYNVEIWGNNIWYLFHTIAHKIKEDQFLNAKNDLIYLIKTICGNLPCPECSKDATETLNKINFNTINSKQEFKTLLFNFHNYVNKKLKKPIYNEIDLDEKYSKANIYILYKNFKIIFSSNSNVPQLMSASFHRKNNLPKIENALNSLLNKFE
tara:strand:- start:6350 stop:6811 length:462 start_codon:yes stop_codon:yes gene_type:complete